ncbi:MAG TPA: metal-dependent hydrolase [Candidatus Polarisedimenticolaceae bacterium]|nr:metal-dependent hydrolase [Candidatus Polarisedimenticolaceae bacterium]
MLKLGFHGHSCWELDDGKKRVLIDPFLTGNPLARVGPDHFDKLDAIIVTHGHGDHLGDAVRIARASGALVVSNFEIATYVGARDCQAHPMHIGGGRKFPFGHVKFTIAHHGSTGPEGEALGNPMGVVITMGGKKVYHAGDTGLFLDMKLIGEMYGPLDVALLPIGDNFTMGIDDAVKACEFLRAKITIPMHYDTFEPIKADPNEFVAKVADRGGRALVINPGQVYELG